MIASTFATRTLEVIMGVAPLLLKGIVTAEDALVALEYDVNGIIVSNHGGRQLCRLSDKVAHGDKLRNKNQDMKR
ncbi:MAG TPA: alpha-hydroxy-acid oxidizing protein [Ktedonobacteraceae bacterium]|jgi:hypothetical protein